MTLVKYRPNMLLSDLFNDDFFSTVFNDAKFPAHDIVETDANYVVHLMVPGLDKKDFKLEIDDDKLVVEGERTRNESIQFTVKQSYFGKFKKIYTLPKNVIQEKITAKYENGILSITVPKNVEKIKSKIIEVV